MPRIAPLSLGQGGPFARFVLFGAKRRLGRVPDSFGVTAHHQGMLAANTAFELALERTKAVDVTVKELATIKAASLVGCEFCLDIGSWLARTHGVTEAQLRDIVHHEDSDAFSELEKRVLDYAAAMSRTPVDVPDELFEALRAHFDERQLVELTGTIAWENHRARSNAALGLGAQGFSEGATCALPAQSRAHAVA